MKALITGAASGLGLSFAKLLNEQNYDLILVDKDKNKLNEVKKEFNEKTKIIVADLSDVKNVKEIYIICKNDNIDLLINNAGFGLNEKFNESDLNTELNMINTNITAVHILTKLFLKDMVNKNSGYILNVSSIASFLPGPKMATYHATKSYVRTLTESINEELRRNKKDVTVSALCPGPINTNFNNVSNGIFTISSLEPDYVAKYTLKKLLKKKVIIIPGIKIKIALFFTRFISKTQLRKLSYKFNKKTNNDEI